MNGIFSLITFLLIGFLLFVVPILITGINFVNLFKENGQSQGKSKQLEVISELLTFVLGIPLTCILLTGWEIEFFSDWNVQLVNSQIHTPIWTGAHTTIIVFTIIALIGYFILRMVSIKELSPIIIVMTMGCIYIGIILSLLAIIQVVGTSHSYVFYLSLFPLNYILLSIKLFKKVITEWNKIKEKKEYHYKNSFLQFITIKLMKSAKWPLYAFIVMIPILGIGIIILTLFGQQPDSIIKAWTETSDWTLSQKIAPQNLIYDEHYLCTVAAGGHEKVVKPQRMGIRHGHSVIVNRQLCIANAFEQILEEKLPKFHKVVRSFYDTYGFPLAKVIQSKYIADLIYLVMKPLEWIFLFFIYLIDKNPENRIAMQYIKPIPNDFSE